MLIITPDELIGLYDSAHLPALPEDNCLYYYNVHSRGQLTYQRVMCGNAAGPVHVALVNLHTYV